MIYGDIKIFLNVPVPIWGIYGYLFFFVLVIFAGLKSADKTRIWSILFLLSVAFCVYSLILAAISTFLIHSYCLMCVVSYAINFSLLYFCWIIRKRFNNESIFTSLNLDILYLSNIRKVSIPLISLFLIVSMILPFTFKTYWHLEPPSLSTDIPQGVTEDGYPWIGAQHPDLVITEFTDYLCFPCKKFHFFLRHIIAKNPEKIRLVHRHFPMDDKINPVVGQPFHIGSAKLALMAVYALKNDKFWEMNDFLYNHSEKKAVNVKNTAAAIGLDYEKMKFFSRDVDLLIKLREDIKAGLDIGLNGTPGYHIEGNTYQGEIPPDILKRIME